MRSKKALYNLIVSLTCQAVVMVCGLITPRLILGAFGSSFNGVVSSATKFLSMISILTLGIAGATRVELYKTLAKGDTEGTSRIVRASQKYMRKVAGGVVIYACILMVIYPFISKSDLTHIESATLIAIISIGSFMEYFFGYTYNTLLTADQSNYIYSFFRIVSTILNTVFVYILIRLGANIFIVKLASSLAFALTPIGMSMVVKRRYNLDLKCEPDMTALNQRGSVAMHSIANIVHDNAGIVVLTIFTTAKEISVYTVHYLVIGNIKMIMNVFVTGLEAAFGNMWAKKEYEILKNRFKTYEFLMYSFTTVVFTCVGLLIVDFVAIYTTNIVDVNYIRPRFAILITVAEAIFCIRQPYLTLVQATGHYKETRNGAVLEAAVNIAISLVFVWLIGIEGVVVGTLAANLIRTSQYAWFSSKKILHNGLKHILCRVLILIMSCSSIILISSYLTSSIVIDSWGAWIIKGCIVFTISVAVWFVFSIIFARQDLHGMFNQIKKMVNKR